MRALQLVQVNINVPLGSQLKGSSGVGWLLFNLFCCYKIVACAQWSVHPLYFTFTRRRQVGKGLTPRIGSRHWWC